MLLVLMHIKLKSAVTTSSCMMSWHKNILNLKASEVKQGLKVNCFAVTTSYFQDELIEKCLTAEEMLNWLVENTEQIANPEINDVFVI